MNFPSVPSIGTRSLEVMRKQLMSMPPQQLLKYLYNPSPNDPPQYLVVSALKEQEDLRRTMMAPPQQPTSTVAQQVAQAVASSPLPTPPKVGSRADAMASMPPAPSPFTNGEPEPTGQGQPPQQPQPQIPGMAQGGVASLPYEDRYVGGGIVSFAEGGRKEDKENKKKTSTEEQLQSARNYLESLETGGFNWGYSPRQQAEADADYAKIAAALGGVGQFGNQALGNVADVALSPFKAVGAGVKSLLTDTSPEGMEYYRRTGKFRSKEEGSPTEFAQFTSRAMQQGPGEIRTASTEEDPRLTALKQAMPNATPQQMIEVLGTPTPSAEGENIRQGLMPKSPFAALTASLAPGLNQPTGNEVTLQELPTPPASPTPESILSKLDAVGSQVYAPPASTAPKLLKEEVPQTQEEYLAEKKAREKAFGVDTEGYLGKREARVAEREKDLEGTKTRAWALPLLQASLALMGQPGSLGRGISKVAPEFGAGLERGYEKISEQKSLLDKSRDALDEARYAASVNDMQGFQNKIEEVKKYNRAVVTQNNSTENTRITADNARSAAFALATLQNSSATQRAKIQAEATLAAAKERSKNQLDVLTATLGSKEKIAEMQQLALAARRGQDIRKNLVKMAQEELVNDANYQVEADAMKKKNPNLTDEDIRKMYIKRSIDRSAAFIGNFNLQEQLNTVRGTAGAAGLDDWGLTPVDTGEEDIDNTAIDLMGGSE